MAKVGRNIEASVKDDKLTIVINLKEKGKASKSGKNRVIATTGGNVTVDGTDDLKLGLNAYFPE